MDFYERLKQYERERANLLQKAKDRPASEIAALLAELVKKWEV